MKKIAGVGACVYDTLAVVEKYPAEDTKIKAEKTVVSGGGPVATGLVAAAKLGADCAYLGALAADAAGDYLMSDFNRYGVSTEFIERADGVSFTSTILLSLTSNTRTCVFDRGTVSNYPLTEKQRKAVAQADVLMVDGNNLESAIEAAEIAVKHGVKVLYDAGGLYEGVERLLPYSDYLIPSIEFALKITKTESVEKAAEILFERYSPRAVVITMGDKGGLIYDGKKAERYPAFNVKAVDTNGAGDVFHGAFAFFLSMGLKPDECARYSSAVSALKCTVTGARAGSPNLTLLKEFLLSRGEDIKPLEKTQ